MTEHDRVKIMQCLFSNYIRLDISVQIKESHEINRISEATNWLVFVHKSATVKDIEAAFASRLHLANDIEIGSKFDSIFFSVFPNQDFKIEDQSILLSISDDVTNEQKIDMWKNAGNSEMFNSEETIEMIDFVRRNAIVQSYAPVQHRLYSDTWDGSADLMIEDILKAKSNFDLSR